MGSRVSLGCTVRGDDVEDPSTYLVAFDESEARYLLTTQQKIFSLPIIKFSIVLAFFLINFSTQPLPTKLLLRKKKAKEDRSTDEVEHFPAPARVTVRRRDSVASIEHKEPENYEASQRGKEDVMEREDNGVMQDQDDQSSGAE